METNAQEALQARECNDLQRPLELGLHPQVRDESRSPVRLRLLLRLVYSSATFGILELPSRRFTVHRIADGADTGILRITAGVRDRRRFRD